jgi:hypothetical protein
MKMLIDSRFRGNGTNTGLQQTPTDDTLQLPLLGPLHG